MNRLILLALIYIISIEGYSQTETEKNAIKILRPLAISSADTALTQLPITVTASICKRSAGGIHDFYSEGDYWWPNPINLSGPYIQKDGETNPDIFMDHRKAMIRFSTLVGTLTSAYKVTGNKKYSDAAITHLKAWFIDTDTKMNPSLNYGQAIKGRTTGRGVGIIDMIQMMEVAQSVIVLEKHKAINLDVDKGVKLWFSEYLNWVTTHPYGIEERDAKNNHGTCWVMQVAVFAKLTENQELLEDCKRRFKTILLPNQMDNNGSFPLELARTKPYGYSLFNLDAMATICQVLSTKTDNLWEFKTPDNKNIKKSIEFMYPFMANKNTWTFPPDVMYYDEWPVAHPSLLFFGINTGLPQYFNLWKKLEHFPKVDEVIRNLPVSNPIIWIN